MKTLNRISNGIAPENLGVVDQVRQSMLKKNRLAMLAGAVLGGFVPAASFEIARFETAASPAMYVLVTAALIYSAMSVYDFAKTAFKHPLKALSFVVLLEGILVFAKSSAVSYAGLSLLVAINAIAAGNALALDQRRAR